MQSPKVLISDSHAQSYADKMPPWGFNGLGYVTYKRTYARPIFIEGTDQIERTEECMRLCNELLMERRTLELN